LVLIGGLSAGALTGCGPGGNQSPPIGTQNVYTNNYYVSGVGYYHAPFRAFYQIPYNFYEPKSQQYFFGGQWAASPHQSITNISAPTSEVAAQAEAQRTDIPRSGFGSTSRTHSIWS
jgi:hypothetical protein